MFVKDALCYYVRVVVTGCGWCLMNVRFDCVESEVWGLRLVDDGMRKERTWPASSEGEVDVALPLAKELVVTVLC